jgi:ADP-ribose pyrophosphatase YjhB (NUDIX family)
MNTVICSGALFFALDTQRFLFLHRARGKRSNVWGLVGGTNENCETPWEGLKREIDEEIGKQIIVKSMPLETFVSNDKIFNFHTYLCIIEKEFHPLLNSEHDGYAWVSYGKWPRPLHYGLHNTLNKKQNKTKIQTLFEITELLNVNE